MENRFELFTKGITAIYRWIQKIKNIEMTDFGLKGMHVMCLMFLSQNPKGLTAAELCDKCMEDKATISRAVAKLKEKKYVCESQPDDKKKYRSVICLTDEGKKIADMETDKINQAVIAGGVGLTDVQREDLYSSLAIISNNLKTYFQVLKGSNQ